MLAVNTLLQDRYRVLRPIGRGSTGAVYRALDQRLDQPVALKQILRHGPRLHQAFEREARLLAALRHPALPKVTDFFVEPTGQFLVMEYIPGDDLAEAALRRIEPFAPRQVLDWTFQLLDALAYLHEQDPPIVHRDVKPHNLKLIDGKKIVLLDFGLAQDTSGPPGGEDVEGYTPRYAPLEQIQGRGTDPRSDLYGLAATVYDLLTGLKPPDPRRRLAALEAGKADPLQPAVSVGVSEVLLKGMALRPEGRFASARDMRLALEAALERRAAVPHNLPAQTSPLVGRRDEIRAARRAFLQEGARLLTLTGPGGVGKTRLGLQIATALLDDFGDGVFFVPLASLRDPELVVSRLASSLGVKQGRGEPLRQQVQVWLGDKRTLLLFDNFEHLLDAALLVSDLLAACPGLKVLATSREALNLRGERAFPVPPLTAPDLGQVAAPRDLLRYDALQLFARRARAACPSFELDEGNATDVAEICARLDGLPLAIELAAAHARALSPAEILARLARRFELLQRGPRDLPARQQTLRATLDWSHALLEPEEQKLFRRLAAFVGGFTPQAVKAICGPALEIDVVAGLASLTDKHLLQREANDPPRYAMLATVQAYAAERLAASGEETAFKRRHAAYFSALAQEVQPELTGAEPEKWFDRLEAEHDNLRAALAWSFERGAVGQGLQMAEALWRFWQARGHHAEGRRWLEMGLTVEAEVETGVRAWALSAAGNLAQEQGDYQRATSLHRQALRLWRQSDFKRGVGIELNNLALIMLDQGHYAQAEKFLEESLALSRAVGNKNAVGHNLNNLGIVALRQGFFERAQSCLRQSLAVFQELDDKRAMSLPLINLCEVAQRKGHFSQAAEFGQRSLELFKELGDRGGIAKAYTNLVRLARYQGDVARAIPLCRQALLLRRELGDRRGLMLSLVELGIINSMQGANRRAVRLLSTADALRQALNAPLPLVDQAEVEETLGNLRARLGAEAFDAAWVEGQAWPLERAVAYALET